MMAGMSVACVTLPVSIASGMLAYAPMGAGYAAKGAVAGLCGAVAAGIVAALLASSSFIVTSPRASIAAVQATLAAHFFGHGASGSDPELIVVATTLTVLLAGLWQILFGVLDLGRIIKFAPHPVVAGFLNAIALLIVVKQLGDFVKLDAAPGRWLRIEHPLMLVFVAALAAFIIWLARSTSRIPAPLAGLAVGTVLFYAGRTLLPGLDLGSTLGPLPIALPAMSRLVEIENTARASLVTLAPDLLLVSLTLATVATVESLLAFRVAQNLADLPPRPPRDLIAQGAGNCAAALAGGIAATASLQQLNAAFGAGGRTRVCGITSATLILVAGVGLAPALAAIPVAVLSAILLATGIALFDRWSLRIVRETLARRPLAGRLGAWQNLSVVVMVMVVTVGVSTVAGVLAGVALSCLIFIVDMSRPIVRRGYRGDEVFSKRVRSAGDAAILGRTGSRRAVLELEGVLFFGNAENLSATVRRLLDDVDMVLLDLRGVSDVDVSGLAILDTIVSSSRKRGQTVAFCNVPSNLPGASMSSVGDAVPAVTPTFPDLDSALEWMEDKALETATESRSRPVALSLGELDLFRDFDEADVAIAAPYLTACEFPAGAAICREGDDADRVWILIKGSVSIRLRSSRDSTNRRISGLAQGTTVGEMALIEGGKRSATAVADEDVMCLALDRAAFDAILRDHPKIATKLLTNIVRLMSQRMRRVTEELRVLKG